MKYAVAILLFPVFAAGFVIGFGFNCMSAGWWMADDFFCWVFGVHKPVWDETPHVMTTPPRAVPTLVREPGKSYPCDYCGSLTRNLTCQHCGLR